MKISVLFVGLPLMALCVGKASAWDYARNFIGGSKDMIRAYRDMREANQLGADKYFRARGNYEAARRGEGGRAAAALFSNGKSMVNRMIGLADEEEIAKDKAADAWGRLGGNPNKFRPEGLDPNY